MVSALLLSAVVTIVPAQLPDNVLSLRSTEIDGGKQTWTMKQMDQIGSGEAVSKADYDDEKWLRAIVPGTVLTSLVANRVLPEPYFGLNNVADLKLIPDLAETGPDFYTFWFRTEFDTPRSFRGKHLTLQFDGINYRAEVWLNGHHLGNLAGMFNRGRLDATPYMAKKGKNALAIKVFPVDNPGGLRAKSNSPRAPGENINGGDGTIGKDVTMLMSVGWDFTFADGIRDRNTGIWRDVKLVATGPVALKNPFVKSKIDLPSANSAEEAVVVEAENVTDEPQTAQVQVEIPATKAKRSQEVTLAPRETKEVVFEPIEVQKPRLWWPLNKGEQYLYDLKAEVIVGKQTSDRLKTKFGIREIRSDLNTPDKSRMFYVNGHRFFVRGSNWIPEAMLRNSRARTEAELRYTAQSGVNFLRQWGGGITESDDFYELCDELGIIVWTEFWQTGNTTKPTDPILYRANVADTVKRIRNHACNGYYVSANERDDIIPIKDLLDQLDGTTGYQIQSEVSGIHDGSPYKYVNPMYYYDDTASPRGSRINGFCPEYGTPILPTVECLREMMPEKDLWPVNRDVWNYLDGGGFHLVATDYKTAVDQYGPSTSIDEFAKKAQAVGAIGYRGIWECWNENRYEYGDRFTSGFLFWYHNSPVPQVAGRMWDWSLEPTAALYFTQDALEPIHAQFDFIKNTVSVNNEFIREFKGVKVRARIFDIDSQVRFDKTVSTDLPLDGVANDILKLDFPEAFAPIQFIRLDVTDSEGKPISDTFYWRSSQAYAGPKTLSGPLYGGFEPLQNLASAKVEMSTSSKKSKGKTVWTAKLTNPSSKIAFLIQLKLQDEKTSRPIRPAFYSDNWISLLPGESRTITIETAQPNRAKLVLDGWNLARN
ncbi:MAG: glycoside hydrolase family 2 [Armatimonadetes bacterium 55-13]|nr:glycoside hydrolase family 2 [Armatimonadota bacterium]OJU61420.1 MAG: glycoside hydrolase family 2 [Armatimonadetes bacterium 55-13]